MFSDLALTRDCDVLLQMSLRLLIAAILGGLLGWQRGAAGKNAGMRTYMLVAVCCAFMVIVTLREGFGTSDMSRVVQGLLTGIGFLGAGSILKLSGEHEVQGLTTAAGLWLTSAIGIAAGFGRLSLAIIATLVAFAILSLLGHFQDQLTTTREHED